MNNDKVALIQGKLSGGGRTRVLLCMIEAINNLGIRPTVYSYQRLPKKAVKERFGKEPLYQVVQVHQPIPLISGVLQKAYLNFNVSNLQKKHDIIINSTNNLLGLNGESFVISYLHHLDIAMLKRRKDNSVARRLYHNAIKNLYKTFTLETKSLFSNSKYTRRHIESTLKMCGVKCPSIDVLYPPVDTSNFQNVSQTRSDWVTSIGRFGKGDVEGGKRGQLWQIALAKRLPSFSFHIVGGAKQKESIRYLKRCREAKRKEDIDNVELYPNASLKKLKTLIGKSKFYLHSKRKEPFGITTVEAIQSGAIPVVPDSGGQKEIVPLDRLRYDSMGSAVRILRHLHDEDCDEMISFLERHTEMFDEKHFVAKMETVVSNLIS